MFFFLKKKKKEHVWKEIFCFVNRTLSIVLTLVSLTLSTGYNY